MSATLKSVLEEFCPCCGRGGEGAVKYVKKHDKDPKALYEEAIKLGDNAQGWLIGILSCDEYNIFTPWFKALLIYCRDSGKTGCSWQAKELLKYHKEHFDKVEELK